MINFLWLPITFQDTALLTIAVPATTARLAPANHVFVLSILASMTALATMLVPPVSGWLSDARRRRGGSRSSFVFAGLAIDVAALVGLAYANTLPAFAILLVIATLGSNIALSAYQAMLPEAVPRKHWGIVSGIRGVATLAGTIIGFAIAGLAPRPEITYLAAAGVMGVGAISLLGVREGAYGAEEEHAHVRDWHDFMVVFVGRALVFFGLTLLQTFVLYFFRDVLRLGNPSAGTALYAFATVIGAVASSVVLGILSDRAPRKIITALACACLALATIGFAVVPELRWILPCAVLFGIRIRRSDLERVGVGHGRRAQAAQRRPRPGIVGRCDDHPKRDRAARRRLANRPLPRRSCRLSSRLRTRSVRICAGVVDGSARRTPAA